MPLNNVDRAKLFLGFDTPIEAIKVSEPPSLYDNFEAALSEAHNLAQGKQIHYPDGLVCPGQLALYKAAQTLNDSGFALPARLQIAAHMLGLAANDSATDNRTNPDLKPLYHSFSAGSHTPGSREAEAIAHKLSDEMLDSLSKVLAVSEQSQKQALERLTWDFSDRILNSRHCYNGDEHSGWWYNGSFLMDMGDYYELFYASTNIGETFGKAWEKDPNTQTTRNPLLNDTMKSEAELFLGAECSTDLSAKIGYVMAPTNNVSRLFHSVVEFSQAFNATTQTTLVSGGGQLSMNVSPGNYDAFGDETEIFSEVGHEHLLCRLNSPIFSANDFSSYRLGGTLVGIKATWGKN